MEHEKLRNYNLLKKINQYTLIALLFWSIFVVIILFFNLNMIRENTLQIAENFAHESYRKDVLYREWNTKIDGLYGKISEYLPPNPYLKTDKKIITTTEGEKFTLINPAYMTRMVHDLGKKNLNIGRYKYFCVNGYKC